MKNYQNKIKPSRLGQYIKNYPCLVSVPFLAQTKMFFLRLTCLYSFKLQLRVSFNLLAQVLVQN